MSHTDFTYETTVRIPGHIANYLAEQGEAAAAAESPYQAAHRAQEPDPASVLALTGPTTEQPPIIPGVVVALEADDPIEDLPLVSAYVPPANLREIPYPDPDAQIKAADRLIAFHARHTSLRERIADMTTGRRVAVALGSVSIGVALTALGVYQQVKSS